MPLNGALFNPRAELELRALTDVVAQARASEPRPHKPQEPASRRPGWAIPVVLDVLREATTPLSVSEVAALANDRSNRKLALGTVRKALQVSAPARTKLIRKVPSGRYGMYEIDRALDTENQIETSEPGRRPGWVASLVTQVLREAAAPMAVSEIAAQIHELSHEPVAHSSVTWIVKSSKQAKAGMFVRSENGHYGLSPDAEAAGPIS